VDDVPVAQVRLHHLVDVEREGHVLARRAVSGGSHGAGGREPHGVDDLAVIQA
jgi:hypothetical protein